MSSWVGSNNSFGIVIWTPSAHIICFVLPGHNGPWSEGFENWLGGLDSNQDNQIQNLMYCRLYDLPAEGDKKSAVLQAR